VSTSAAKSSALAPVTRPRTYVVTGSGSPLGQRTTRRLSATGARVITVDTVEADVVAELRAPSGRSAMVRGVAAFTGGVVDGVVVTAVLDVADRERDRAVEAGVEGLYFAPVAAIAGLRPLLAGSGAPRAVAVTGSPTHPLPDDALVEACLSGDEGHAIELADRLFADGRGGVVASSAATALQVWIGRHARTREWAGRGIPLVGVESGQIARADDESEEDLAAFVTELAIARVLPVTGTLLEPHAVPTRTGGRMPA